MRRGGQRVDAGILDRVVLAGEGDVRLGPQRLHDLDLLLRAAAAVAEILVEAGELDRVPADPDPEPEASAAQHVERGGLLGDEHGLALRQDQHLGRELDIPGAVGEKAEQDKRVVEQIGRGVAVAPIGAARDVDAEDVVGCGQILIADLLGRLRELADGGRIAADRDIDQRQCDAKFHLDFPSFSVAQPIGTPQPRPDSYTSAGRRAIRRTLMKIVRFASASDGGSQFVEVDIPIDNASTDAFGNTVRRSAILPAQSTMVTEMPEGLYQDWHPASRRQLLIVLSGTLEVETSDGKKHRCSSGDVFLADDVGSRGHRTRTIGGPARVLFVHLPPEANVGG